MRDYLTFHVYGPLCAFGGIAVGVMRGCESGPTKSAVIGLAAGAMGIRRSEEQMHRAMAEGLGLALRIDAEGEPLRDFHTVQTVKPARNAAPATRAQALQCNTKDTPLVSLRDYLCDAAFTVCLWRRGDSAPQLAELAHALERPVFVPYLGRKSCPPGQLFEPRVAPHEDFLAALTARPPRRDFFAAMAKAGEHVRCFWEDETGQGPHQIEVRRDVPVVRTDPRRFAQREEKRGHVIMP
ncbi:crispr-associated protein, cas5e family [hydrocarbon metagenome]|uniref:Crispr-associated protein, cas5e family n=1 Tax=hydrocarbon metagenome TaxID=938273 RepID=A0A0W8GA56_9ZZZZ